jgi:hypothetical protein
MKCNDIDIIKYIEGMASDEAVTHVHNCKNCKNESEKLSRFIGLVSAYYAEGKKLEQELDKRLQSINSVGIKRLPDNIIAKITILKNKSLTSKLRKVIGKSKKDAKGIVERFLTPRMHAIPASPKDITRTKKKKKTKSSKKLKS